jgi:UDP-glucose 4-epimerase
MCTALGVTPRIEYTGGERGWVGDNPWIFLDITRIRKLGWHPRSSIREALLKTLDDLRTHDRGADTHG